MHEFDIENTIKEFKEKYSSLYEKIQKSENEFFSELINDIGFILDNYNLINTNLFNDYFRYSDYYSFKMSISEMIEYFTNNCPDKMNDRLVSFKIYLFAREIRNVYTLFFELNDFNEFIELFSKEELYELRIIVDMLKEICLNKQINETDNLFEFLEPYNEFKILFDGFFSHDLNGIPKNVLMSLMYKLNNQISKTSIIQNAEIIKHIKDKYDVRFWRVHLFADYRVVFYRYNKVVALVGLVRKSNKENDYSRHDAIANNISLLEQRMDMYASNCLDSESEHYFVVEYLKKTLEDRKQK